jgi:chromosome segregation ATPase
MASDLEARVTTLERTVASEIRERMRMSQDIGEMKDLITKRSEAQRRMLQALGDTQSEHSTLLRDIRRTVGWMAPKLDVIETQVAGTSTRMGILEGQMGALEGRMGTLEGQMGTLEGRMGTLEGQMGTLEGQMGTLEGQMGTLEGQVGALEGQVGALGNRMDRKVDALAEEMDRKVDALAVEMNEKFATIIGMLDGRK